MRWGRRQVLQAGAALLLWPWLARAQREAARGVQVVIVGGGFAGATCARELRRLAPALRVTVVEPRAQFYTGPMSNAVTAGLLPPEAVRCGPQRLVTEGITWRRQAVVGVDPAQRRVTLADGTILQGDELLLAPGIAPLWDAIEGLDAQTAEHCPSGWLGDHEVDLLRRRLAALSDGAHLVISAPPLPYRCPPGPYERAALWAWAAQQQGRRVRITLLDAKDDFSKRAAFMAGWERHYPGVIDWVSRRDGGAVVAVEARQQRIHRQDGAPLKADLLSVIPPQAAPAWMRAAGLADSTGWCPARAGDFRSLQVPAVRIIGDAAVLHPMPKSAFSAQAQARLCALAMLAELAGEPPPSGLLINTCYSLLHPQHAISISASYRAIDGRFSTLSEGASAPDLPAAVGAREALQAQAWYRQAIDDAFGGPLVGG